MGSPQETCRRLSFSIHVTSVTYANDNNGENLISDRIDNPVVALPYPVPIRVTRELLTTGRAGVISKAPNSFHDPAPHLLGLDLFDFLCGGSLEADAIACHVA